MAKKLAICVGDGGAYNYFFANGPRSVYNQLIAKGYEVIVYAAPKAVAIDKLAAASVPYTPSDGNVDFSSYALVLFGTIGKKESFDLFLKGTAAAKFDGVPVVWCGDYFGSGCEDIAVTLRPTALFAPDDFTARRFIELRPGYSQEQVIVTGSPVFDPIPGFDYESAREETRSTLGIDRGETLVVHLADGIDQNAFEPYEVLGPWVEETEVKLAVYFHPNDEKVRPKEVAELEAKLKSDLGQRYLDPAKARLIKGLARAAGADLVTTGYSTSAVEACFIGVPSTFIMLEASQERWRKTKNLEKPFFPVLEDQEGSPAPAMGIFFESEDYKLDWALRLTRKEIKTRLAHERFQKLCDGHAADRVAAEIAKLVAA